MKSRFSLSLPLALAAPATAFLFTTNTLAAEQGELQNEVRELRQRVNELEKQSNRWKALDELTVGGNVLAVAQRANKNATTDGRSESQLNYRADVDVTLPLGSIGGGKGELSALLRAGQGEGLARLNSTFAGPNATAFELSGPSQADDSTVLLAQLWYQATIPVENETTRSRGQWQFGFGKSEVFSFFDQNAVAGDEAQQFLNSAFVHNPLLDAGGDVGADAYGFQPGVYVGYLNETNKPLTYGVSLGIFGAGRGAHYENTFGSPFSIVQFETHQRFFSGLDGHYRFYVWRNGQATPYNNPADSRTEKHAGWGLSVDQRVSENVMLFARYGKETKGRVQFDRALTLGAEFGGEAWGRAEDAVGVAAGRLRASASFRADAPTLDADGDVTPDFGYVPTTSENIYEIYYRYHVTKHFIVSPDLQLIANPGGNGSAKDMQIAGLRAEIVF